MTIVLDSSAALAWTFPDERPPEAIEVLSFVARHGAVVTGIWRLEIMNALLVARRRGRVTTEQIEGLLSDLGDLAITVDQETDTWAWTATTRIAEENGITVYDAAYVELALRRSLPIASFDRDVRLAAAALAIPIIGSPH